GTGGSSGDADDASDGTGGSSGGAGDAASGSCVGICGSGNPAPNSSPACYCDGSCVGFGDCCADYAAACN
ncbi:MAG TPA: hypothetical protein PKD61_28630, partial [Polyangiaceae bacterium]|nr:hypothetical protein [Polyangiaceae bacterium]